MKNHLSKIENNIIYTAQKSSIPVARFAIFIIYVWFGLLKILSLSPATPLVLALFNKTLQGFVSFSIFNTAFGLFEMLIGILILFPKLVRIVVPLLIFHLITTTLPLFILPSFVWTQFLVPTLEGQYIIKNILIVACALIIISVTRPRKNQNI